MKRPLYLAAALLTVALMAPTAPAAASPSGKNVEAKAQRIEKLLTAPCCYKGTLTDHASGLATKMRADIRIMLRQGKSKKQILAHYKKKYGQAVLVEPPGGGLSGFLLYGVPFGLAFIGLLVMTVLMARKRAPSADTEKRLPTNFQIPDEMDKRIDALVQGKGPAPGRLGKATG